MLIARSCPGSILPSVSEEGHPWQRPPCSLLVHAGNSPDGFTVSISNGPAQPLLGSSQEAATIMAHSSLISIRGISTPPQQEESHQAEQENSGPAKALHPSHSISQPGVSM